MNNNNNNNNITSTRKFINETYDHLTFFELYGNSVIIVVFLTLFVFFVFSYCQVMQSRESVENDWVNQRCNPKYLPFAGYITHPEGTTAFQYTSDNFQYCVQNILFNISESALEPFQYMIQSITVIFTEFANSIQQTREAINKLRNGIKQFTQDILSRVLNVMIPIQKMFMALMDTFQKIQGIMVGSLYTMLGTYYTLQALMGAILELIIKVLLALVIIIIGLWILPFTYPAAAATTAVFLAIAIPLSIIIYFMTEVLHIKTSAIPKLRCFDRKTKIFLSDGSFKYIEYINIGDILHDGSNVTAKIKVTSKFLDMFILDGTIVSETHVVNYNDTWIHVSEHPNARKLMNYDEPYLFCLNTSSKTILINNTIFTDWDEIYEDSLDYILKYNSIEKTENISKNFDCGFKKDTNIKLYRENNEIPIYRVKIGDMLSTGGVVYGIVEINNDLGNERLIHLLVSNEQIQIGNTIHYDYNYNIDSILKLNRPKL